MVAQAFSQAPFDLKLGFSITLEGAAVAARIRLPSWDISSPLRRLERYHIPFRAICALRNTLSNGYPIYLKSGSGSQPGRQRVAGDSAGGAFSKRHQPGARIKLLSGLLNNLVTMITAVASLALLAGLIIIANAVALAMLERRRELGILNLVGYTGRSILGEVLMENGAIGFVGAVLAMLLAALAATILASFAFHVTLGTNLALVLVVVVGTSVICMFVAGLVAWNATRIRPLEVLRYE